MKRDDVLAILENAELDTAAKLKSILDLNGNDINAKNETIKKLETAAANHATELEAERNKYKDYESILQERDALKSEKEAKTFEDRFAAVLGNRKPKNDFTKNGLIDLFKSELQKDENKDKKDDEIFSNMVKDKEREYFDGPYRLNMTPSNPSVKAPNSTAAYLDEMYKNNPFYKNQNN